MTTKQLLQNFLRHKAIVNSLQRKTNQLISAHKVNEKGFSI